MRKDQVWLVKILMSLLLGLAMLAAGLALFQQMPVVLAGTGCSGEYSTAIPNGCRGSFGVRCNKGYQGTFDERVILGKRYFVGKCVPGPEIRRLRP